MANGEQDIKDAAKSGDASKIAVAYAAYEQSMKESKVDPRPLSAILGK